jgi:hypothetical protein
MAKNPPEAIQRKMAKSRCEKGVDGADRHINIVAPIIAEIIKNTAAPESKNT